MSPLFPRLSGAEIESDDWACASELRARMVGANRARMNVICEGIEI